MSEFRARIGPCDLAALLAIRPDALQYSISFEGRASKASLQTITLGSSLWISMWLEYCLMLLTNNSKLPVRQHGSLLIVVPPFGVHLPRFPAHGKTMHLSTNTLNSDIAAITADDCHRAAIDLEASP